MTLSYDVLFSFNSRMRFDTDRRIKDIKPRVLDTICSRLLIIVGRTQYCRVDRRRMDRIRVFPLEHVYQLPLFVGRGADSLNSIQTYGLLLNNVVEGVGEADVSHRGRVGKRDLTVERPLELAQ